MNRKRQGCMASTINGTELEMSYKETNDPRALTEHFFYVKTCLQLCLTKSVSGSKSTTKTLRTISSI